MSIQQVAPKPNVTDRVFIECRDVRKTFMLRGHEVQAVKCVDLSIRRGETLLIRGESGAGKSTLLGLLAVLEMPSAGTMTVDGARVDLMQGAALLAWRRRVGFIFQAHNLLLGWTAEENVTAGLMGMGLAQTEQRERARQALDRVGLGSRLDHLPGELSMGERQRVAVARALVRQPAFIVADEPTADVDETSAQLIIKQLLEAARQPDVTLVVATHGDIRPEFTGRVFAMKSGTLIPDGSVS
ncbi:MAG: ABC transporter ATP-binding protein [Thermoguttaceae bacterium]